MFIQKLSGLATLLLDVKILQFILEEDKLLNIFDFLNLLSINFSAK